jgi:hypothetical protein
VLHLRRCRLYCNHPVILTPPPHQMRPVLMSVAQQGTAFEVISGIHRPSWFVRGPGSIAVRGSIRYRNIAVTIAPPPVELNLRGRRGTIFQHPHGFPDRVHNPLDRTKRRLAHDWLAFLRYSGVSSQYPLPWLVTFALELPENVTVRTC